MRDTFTMSCRMGRTIASGKGVDRPAPMTVAGYKGGRIKRIRRKIDVKNEQNISRDGREEHFN